MTTEQTRLVRSGRRLAQSMYARNLNCVSNDIEHNRMITELANIIDKLCDDIEGCDSEKSFVEHFSVLAGRECWWSKGEDDADK